LAWRNRTRVPLALKKHSKRNQPIHLQRAVTIDALIPGSAGYRDLREPRFAEDSLAQLLKTCSGQTMHEFENLHPVVLGRVAFLGGLLYGRLCSRGPGLSVVLKCSYPLLAYFAGLF
jgi:hypothetical protein